MDLFKGFLNPVPTPTSLDLASTDESVTEPLAWRGPVRMRGCLGFLFRGVL